MGRPWSVGCFSLPEVHGSVVYALQRLSCFFPLMFRERRGIFPGICSYYCLGWVRLQLQGCELPWDCCQHTVSHLSGFYPPVSSRACFCTLCYQWQFFDLFHLLKREEICVLASHLFLTSSAGWNSTRIRFLGAWGGKGLSCSHRQSRKNEKEAIKLVSVPLHWDLLSSPWD